MFQLSAMGHALYAQVDTGAILGTVKDQSGAVVPGAKVSLTNEGTTFSVSTRTGVDGSYTFTPVKIGTYRVDAEFQGFQKASHPHVNVDVQQQVVVDFTLQPGQVTQTVEVTAEIPLLQTQNASVGQVVGSREVNDLPLNGRNFTFLAQLSAGVTVGQQEGRGLNASGDFSANGTRPAQNNYLLDGIDNNADLVDFLNGTAFVVLPPVDAIQEFKVQTNNYSAEFGRAGGAVLNASVKSGTNQLHGDAWEFLRNDKLDARDFFEKRRSEFRQNQFGATVGGPIVIPHVYNGRNKTFFFGDYQGTRIRQGTPYNVTVPTAAEVASGYTNFADLITEQPSCKPKGPDLLGRSVPCGTIFDPATTRPVTQGQADPVTGIVATGTGYVRDPFLNNTLPANRLDPNAIKLLQLYPAPTSGGIFNNFQDSPVVRNRGDSFDVRVDHNFSEKDQIFSRVSYLDNPQLKPGPFTGFGDGGAFNQGNQTAVSTNFMLSETHDFSPTLINEARIGLGRIGTGRLQPFGNDTSDIPAKFGIPGVPQIPLNGGLPTISVSNLQQLGSNAFLVSQEFNSTLQVTENLTKIYGSHTFKGGFEFQHIKFATLQPPWSRGQLNFDGRYTSIPNVGDGTTGVAQLLLVPGPSSVPTGVNNFGGVDDVRISNQANTDDGRNYYGLYVADDWKVTPKLTLNLGLRWDYFGQVEENFGAQANFIPGAPNSGAKYLIPVERKGKPPLSGGPNGFTTLAANDGIQIVYSDNPGLGISQKTNFAPRVGLAYQFSPKLVARAGFGIFYGGFENRGYSPNIGENYPFQFDFHLFNPDPGTPLIYSDGNLATLERGFLDIPLDPAAVNAHGLSLRGIQFNYITPYTMGFNLMAQYELTNNDTVSLGYVGSQVRHLEAFPGSNAVSQIVPVGQKSADYVPFHDFGQGASYAATEGNSQYHAALFNYEHRFSSGLSILGNYAYGKVRTDARDLLNGNIGGWQAPYLPGFGIQRDYTLADFDVRNIVHLSGTYQLPLGKGKRWAKSGGIENAILGGWATNWILTLQDGQPFSVGCEQGTTTGLGCFALLVPGQNRIGGLHNVRQWLNPAAFNSPCPLGAKPFAGCAAETGFGLLGGAPSQGVGPGFHRLDFSLFKNFQTSEGTRLEFRAELFNLTNHPNFSLPGDRTFSDANFARITSTRDNPNDPREIQFALKFYF
jgi:hypothetical protein